MKKLLLITIVTLLSLGRLLSNPVDVDNAKLLAKTGNRRAGKQSVSADNKA